MEGVKPTLGSIGDPTPLHPDLPGVGKDVHAAEETLRLALVEVRKTEEQLRAAQEVLDRLQGELAHRLSETELLMTQLSESYERERARLKHELALIQTRASDLGQARGTHTGGAPDAALRALDAPVAPEAPEHPDEVPSKKDEPEAPIQVDEVPSKKDEPEAPIQVDEVPSKKDEPEAPARTDEAPAAPSRNGKHATPPSTDPDRSAEEEEAYEDHWYKVLRQGSIANEIDDPSRSSTAQP